MLRSVGIMFIVDQLVAPISSWKARTSSFAVLPRSTCKRIRYADVEYGMIAICDDVNPKVVITRHNGRITVRDSSTTLGMTRPQTRAGAETKRNYAADTGGADSGLRNEAMTSGRSLSSSIVGMNFDSCFG